MGKQSQLKRSRRLSWQKLLSSKRKQQVGIVMICFTPAPVLPVWSLSVMYVGDEDQPQHYFGGLLSEAGDATEFLSELSDKIAQHNLKRCELAEVKHKGRFIMFASMAGTPLSNDDVYDTLREYLISRADLWDEFRTLQNKLIQEAVAGDDIETGMAWVGDQLKLWRAQKEAEGQVL